jgi:hypothetical protein
LLAIGCYLMEEQFRNPLGAKSVGMLVAALLIATSITLLYCLLHPLTKLHRRAAAWPASIAWEHKPICVAGSHTAIRVEPTNALSFHVRYVDHTRIRIRR